MKALNLIQILAMLALATASADEFYVAPGGSDGNDGAKAKPFATLARAQQAARVAAKPVTIWLRDGTFYLADTLVLTAEDSGTTWQAVANETPVISGGMKLDLRWEPYTNGIWQAETARGLTIDQLFVNGQRQWMARYPNFDPRVLPYGGYSADAFSKERAARWADPTGGYIHAMHRAGWGGYHYRITGKNEKGEVTYEGGWQNNRQMGMHAQYRYVENIFEELDAPGEWFHNSKTGTLYYSPPPGVDLKTAKVEAVLRRHLVELNGAKSILLRGIVFRHAARTFMDTMEPLLRSDWTIYRGGAVVFNNAEDCTIEDCEFDQLGGNAIFVNKRNRRIAIRGCDIHGTGASAVAFVGDPKAVRNPLFEYNQLQDYAGLDRAPGPQTDDYPSDCLVDDCLIRQVGVLEKQAAGVQISMAMGITIRHCSIYDTSRAGINIGDSCWGGHVIEFCDVFDTVKETSDHGCFNSWGRDRYWRPNIDEVNAMGAQAPELALCDAVKTSILRNNRWRCDHGWDIDLDDGSSNYEIYNNLCLGGGIKNREGFYRVVENNIIVNNSFHPHVWFANSQDAFRRNIVFTNYRPIRVKPPWGKEIDFNLLHKPGATPLPALYLQQQSGRDEHSLVGDAQFIDPAHGDYRVKEGSPALKLGFRNFPMDQFGVQKPALKKLARAPVLPDPARPIVEPESKRDPSVATWLGAMIKNVIGLGEVSAAGLPGEIGVRLEKVPPGSGAAVAGLRENDVILKCNGLPAGSLSDFLPVWQAAPPGRMKLEIWRDQKRQIIEFLCKDYRTDP
ncbi:MAG: PDZ domain-containing protein [Candidatus Omnitrophica bacterium]|nr:PDZ domain-containing protein [Candidatus Omnitrophota bacterium]